MAKAETISAPETVFTSARDKQFTFFLYHGTKVSEVTRNGEFESIMVRIEVAVIVPLQYKCALGLIKCYLTKTMLTLHVFQRHGIWGLQALIS